MAPFLKYAAVAISLTTVALALVVIPKDTWDAAIVVSLLLVALSAALPLAAPKIVTGHGRSEVGSLASIGFSGITFMIFLLLAVCAFLLAIYNKDRTLAWGAIVISVGWLLVGVLISRGSVGYLDSAFNYAKPNGISRTDLIQELAIIKASSPASFVSRIETLYEKLQYAGSDLADAVASENMKLLSILKEEITSSCLNNDEIAFEKACSNFNQELSKREISLNLQRTKS